jgi:CubicO group peptidase (beta-lactamase class C family)
VLATYLALRAVLAPPRLGDVQSPAELVTAYLRHLGALLAGGPWRSGVVDHAYLAPPSWAVGVGLVVLLALAAVTLTNGGLDARIAWAPLIGWTLLSIALLSVQRQGTLAASLDLIHRYGADAALVVSLVVAAALRRTPAPSFTRLPVARLSGATAHHRDLAVAVTASLALVGSAAVSTPALAAPLMHVDDREFVTAGAASVRSTPRDMARYLAALLGGGTNEHGSILRPATLATMFAPQFQPDPRLPGMGLGFFRADLGGRPVVEHRGVIPGFNSQIIIAPGEGVGVMAFTNGAKDATMWLFSESCGLLRRLIGIPDDAVRTEVPHRPELWPDICGWYQLDAGITDVRLRATMGAGAEVFVRGDRPMLRFLTPIPQMYGGFPLHPDDQDDPDAFRMDFSEFGMGTTRVVFSREPGAGATYLNLEMMPVSLRRRPARTNPRLWATGALGALGATTAAIAIRQLRR